MVLIIIVYTFFICCSYIIYKGSYNICIKSHNFNSIVVWILSYILLFLINLILLYPTSLKIISEIALGHFEFLLVLIILFYLLRIEERSFEYKYAKGIFISLTIYLVSTTYYSLSKSQITLYDSLDVPISNFYFLLIPIFSLYTLKIIYNILIENKRIRYPIIFLGLPISTLLTGSAIYGFDKTFNMLVNLAMFILFFTLFMFCHWLKKQLVYDSKKDTINQGDNENSILEWISKKILDRFNREYPIKKSEYPLNDEIRDAVRNNKYLNLDNRDLKQLKFMLICANQEAEDLKDGLNVARNWILTGFTLMLVPAIIILFSFFNYLLNLP